MKEIERRISWFRQKANSGRVENTALQEFVFSSSSAIGLRRDPCVCEADLWEDVLGHLFCPETTVEIYTVVFHCAQKHSQFLHSFQSWIWYHVLTC